MAVATESWEQVLGSTDDETASLILQLETEDAELCSDPTNTLLDADFRCAKAIWAQELKDYQAVRNAASTTPELPQVPQEDVPVEEVPVEEAPVAADASVPAQSTPTLTAAGQKRKWGFASQQAGTEAPATTSAKVVLFSCVVCQDKCTADDCLRAPCLHYYCDDCLNDLFRVAMKDEQAYPPRCCKQIFNFEDVQRYFNPDLC